MQPKMVMSTKKVILTLFLGLLAACPLNGQIHRELDSLAAVMKELEAESRKSKGESVDLALADVWRRYAFTAGKAGMTEEAQTYALKAQQVFLEHGEYGMASLCLYERCIAYHSIGDTAHMAQLLGELESLAARDTSALTLYNYYAIRFAYLAAVDADVNAITEAGRNSIAAVERIPDFRRYAIMPVWLYYNQALMYDLRYSPPLTDSIDKYLTLAQASAMTEPALLSRQEAMVSIGDERAWLLYYNKDYARAEAQMQEVLGLLDSVEAHGSHATVITERGEAYTFFVELYTAQGRYDRALEYQQLLTENNKERYSLDRQRVLDEVQTRYEVEKKELTIAHQRTAILFLVIAAALVLIAVLAALIALSNRKRRIEEELYAKALEVETMRNVEPLEVLRNHLLSQIKQPLYREAIGMVDMDRFRQSLLPAEGLSNMDKRYLLCFAAGLTPEQVAEIFHVEPASVYTVRYRIKKKFPSKNAFF